MKDVSVIVTGELTIRILHSKTVKLQVPEDMDEDEIHEMAKEKLEEDYYNNIEPVLNQLDSVVDEWELREHYEEAEIEEDED